MKKLISIIFCMLLITTTISVIGIEVVKNDEKLDGSLLKGDPGWIMQVENTTAESGTTGHVIQINGTWAEELDSFSMKLEYDNEMIEIDEINADGCVAEVYQTYVYIFDNIFTYSAVIDPPIPAGEGKLGNIVVNVTGDFGVTELNFVEGGSTYYNYYGGVHHPIIINGTLTIVGENYPPPTPQRPQGPSQGYENINYSYSTTEVSDIENHDIFYKFDWGDATHSDWLSEPTANHSWAEGEYEIKIKAKDEYGQQSNWSEPHVVTISPIIPELLINCVSSVMEDSSFEVTVTSKGDLIDNAKVEFNGEIKTTDGGKVTFDSPQVDENSDFTITASLNGYDSDTKTIRVLNRQENEPRGYIYGEVFTKNFQPIQGATVCIKFSDKTSNCEITDEYGRYSIVIPVGIHTVTVTSNGFESQTKHNIEVEVNRAQGVNFYLEQSNSENGEDENQIKIDDAIKNGQISGKIIFDENDNNVDYQAIVYIYDIEFSVKSINDERISLIVGAETGTSGTTVIFELDENVLKDDDFGILVDDKKIDKASSLDDVLLVDEDKFEWFVLEKEDGGLWLILSIPHFSQHEITIYKIVDILGGPVAIAVYSLITVIFLLVFIFPINSNFKRMRRTLFRKKGDKY